MERKIGEIFEYNGEWYQCVEDTEDISCVNCCFYNGGLKLCTEEDIGACVKEYRSDAKSICFKKLEKVGEPFTDYCPSGRVIYFQRYKCYQKPITTEDIIYWADDVNISIEIKQTKEDMEEREIGPLELPEDLEKIAKETVESTGRIVAEEIERQIKANLKREKLSKLRPFDLEAARSGKPVCTRDGRKARIICFDAKSSKPIIALVDCNGTECIMPYFIDGRFLDEGKRNDTADLMMFSEKKEMWINIYKGTTGPFSGSCLYDTEEEAKDAVKGDANYVTTTKVCWEE